MRRGLLYTITGLLCLMTVTMEAVAKSGSQTEDRLKSMNCLITTDFYIVHFTAFQEPKDAANVKERFKPLCQDIPAVGNTYITVDLVDRDVRATPVALRVVEAAGSEAHGPAHEGRTLLDVPAKIYKTGVIDTQVNLKNPGHYTVIVSIGEDIQAEEERVRIPLRVALETGSTTSIIVLVVFIIIIVGATYAVQRYARADKVNAIATPKARHP